MKRFAQLIIFFSFLLSPLHVLGGELYLESGIINNFLLDTSLSPASEDKYIETTGRKTVYLTFDDGPSPYTHEILRVLKDYNVAATFFLIGNNIWKYPQLTKDIACSGNSLGLHTMSHNSKKIYVTPSILIRELQDNYLLLDMMTGIKSKLVRVPYGSMPYMKKVFREALKNEEFKMWDWTIDSEDWKYNDQPYAIFEQILGQIQRQEEIVLLHETKQTAAALPLIISYFHSLGYQFKSYDSNHHNSHNFWGDTGL